MKKSKEEEMAELMVSYIDSLKENIEELEKENKELKEKLDKIEKARIKYEDVFYKVTRQWDDNYGELDEIIMNR